MRRKSPLLVLFAVAFAALAALAFALAAGSVDIGLDAVARALLGRDQDAGSTIVRELRLPRCSPAPPQW